MEVTPQMITQFGLMNKISTGNSLLDMVLCLMVPMLVRHCLPRLNAFIKRRLRFWKSKIIYTRTITYDRPSDYWYDEATADRDGTGGTARAGEPSLGQHASRITMLLRIRCKYQLLEAGNPKLLFLCGRAGTSGQGATSPPTPSCSKPSSRTSTARWAGLLLACLGHGLSVRLLRQAHRCSAHCL